MNETRSPVRITLAAPSNPPSGKMEAEVALTADGRPLLTRLYVNGRPYP